MKVPLEPIPTEQMATAKTESLTNAKGGDRGLVPNTSLTKAYPWLLGVSVALSATLCWMYVTKPVIVSAEVKEVEEPMTDIVTATPVKVDQPKALPGEPALVPSGEVLPGEESSEVMATASAGSTAEASEGLNKPVSSGLPSGGVSWENTNLKVQHILRADAGNGELEKIILNVPVRYETRTMRWDTGNIEQARNILARLMIYERDLNNLRQQGKGILKDWDNLIGSTVPATVLRADSPSLPYNHGSGTQPKDLPDSAAVIQVDEPKVSEK